MLIKGIILVGCSERQIDYWDKMIFGYKEVVSYHITGDHQTVGFHKMYYMLVGEWEKNPRINRIITDLKMRCCKEIELVYEDNYVL